MSELKFLEEDMNPYLISFAKKEFGINCKIIIHSKSKGNKGYSGKNKWIHPDVVGFCSTKKEFKSELRLLYRQMNQDIAYFYSFELKQAISLSNLKECYFQAVSDSSWANEGYLVVGELDENNQKLMDEVKRLVQAFGIGIIKLDLLNLDYSKVLFEATKRKQLNYDTMNKLMEEENTDFIEFVETVNSCLSVKNQKDEEAIINHQMERVWSDEELMARTNELKLKKASFEEKEVSDSRELEMGSNDGFIKIKEVSFDDFKVRAIKVGGQVFKVKRWRDCFFILIEFCKKQNKEKFDSLCYDIPGSENRLFLYKRIKSWKNQRDERFKRLDDNTWVYKNFYRITFYNNLLDIIERFELDENEVLVKGEF